MITCEIRVSEILCDGLIYNVYGFTFYKDGKSEPFKVIDDVLFDFEKAVEIVKLINNSDISEFNIEEIIDDILN